MVESQHFSYWERQPTRTLSGGSFMDENQARPKTGGHESRCGLLPPKSSMLNGRKGRWVNFKGPTGHGGGEEPPKGLMNIRRREQNSTGLERKQYREVRGVTRTLWNTKTKEREARRTLELGCDGNKGCPFQPASWRSFDTEIVQSKEILHRRT